MIRFVLSFVLSLVLSGLTACGGGEETMPLATSQSVAQQPRIEFLGFTELGYAKLRLTFTSSTGFSQPVAVSDEVVWHSGMIHADQPSAPRAKVQQAADGSLYADVVLYYTTDRGVFGAVPAGRSVTLTQGQPTNVMVINDWQMPVTLKAVPLADGTGRTWIDVKF